MCFLIGPARTSDRGGPSKRLLVDLFTYTTLQFYIAGNKIEYLIRIANTPYFIEVPKAEIDRISRENQVDAQHLIN